MTPEGPGPTPAANEIELRADCERCAALCCVAVPFSRSPEFAFDKDAGVACPHLGDDDFRCTIHADLAQEGFRGCEVYECWGAGQFVTQHTFAGRDWRRSPEIADAMFAAFRVVRRLQEQLLLLTEALRLPEAEPLRGELEAEREELSRLRALGPDELAGIDVDTREERARALLRRLGRRAEHRRDRLDTLVDLRRAEKESPIEKPRNRGIE